MLSRGANDDNDTRHNSVKNVYALNNRQTKGLIRQLLQAGYADDDLKLKYDRHVPTSSEVSGGTLFCTLSSPVRYTEHEISSSIHFHDRIQHVHIVRYKSNRRHVWTSVQFVSLNNKVPWLVDLMHQYLMDIFCYMQYKTKGRNIRMDACEYLRGGTRIHVLIQSVFRSNSNHLCSFLVVRRLQCTDPPVGNALTVTLYNNEFYKYSINKSGGLQLDFVPKCDYSTPYSLFLPVH